MEQDRRGALLVKPSCATSSVRSSMLVFGLRRSTMRSISTEADVRLNDLRECGVRSNDPTVNDKTARVCGGGGRRPATTIVTRREGRIRASRRAKSERETPRDVEDTYLRVVHQRRSHQDGDGDAKRLRAHLHGRYGRVRCTAQRGISTMVRFGSKSRFVW